MNPAAISITHLDLTFPGQSVPIFTGLNLEISKGERFGLFGPNGAGKTTLMNCMTGLLSFKKGTIELFGNNIRGNKKVVNTLFGLVPQDFSFYQELSPVENLRFFGAAWLCQRWRV